MLNTFEAKKLGIKACINKIGYDFCNKYADNSTSSWGEKDDKIVSCFVGINTDVSKEEKFLLTHEKNWDYFVHCDVNKETGEINFLDFKIP